MIRLPDSLKCWGADDFSQALKRELEAIPGSQLPLQQGLAFSSYAIEDSFSVMVLACSETEAVIKVRVGVHYQGMIAGCNCADDPSPVDLLNEYCELLLLINKTDSLTTVSLLS